MESRAARHRARRIEVIVLEQHERRRANRAGRAQWRVEGRGIVVLYDWPVGDDRSTALVRTVWRG
jgi:hypothetical protein